MTALLAIVAVITTGAVTPAFAYWSSTGSAAGAARTGTLTPPTSVIVPASAAGSVTISWTAGTGGVVAAGYFVTRTSEGSTTPVCASSPTSLIAGTTCTDTAVPDGVFRYEVTAVYRSWTAASSASTQVMVVNAAAVAFGVGPTSTLQGVSITPAVTVNLRTAEGNPYHGAGVPLTLTIGTNQAGGVLHGSTTVTTDANGVATFDNLSINAPGTGYTLAASSPGLLGATSAFFTVIALLLGAAQGFSLLGGTAVVNTEISTVSGDVGVSPGVTVTGFTNGAVGGDIHGNDAVAVAAQSARETAYNDLKTRTANAPISADLGGQTFLPGVYHSTAALALTGTVILDGNGDPNAAFIFQSDAAFDTAALSKVILQNGTQAANVYWVVNGAAGTGANAQHAGTIIADGAITLGAGTTLIGRALAAGAVTLAGGTIRFTDALPPTITIAGGATATTKLITPTITGTSNAVASGPVTVRVAGQILSTTVGGGGTWSVSASALAAGGYDVVATVRDAAGNGAAATQLLTVEVNPAPVDLGTAGTDAVLARTSITSTGATVVNGDLGLSPGPQPTGFPPGVVNGATELGLSPAAAAAQIDLLAAIDEASARAPHTQITGDLAGRTFHLGVHHQTAAMALTGTVTLDAEGNPGAVFIFQTDAAFNTAAGSGVILAGGAQAGNVYWVIGGAAGTGATTSLAGTILARGAITLGAGTIVDGRALSRDAVTLSGNTITRPGYGAFSRLAVQTPANSDLSARPGETAANEAAAGGAMAPGAETAVEPMPSPPPGTTPMPRSPMDTAPTQTTPTQTAPTDPPDSTSASTAAARSTSVVTQS